MIAPARGELPTAVNHEPSDLSGASDSGVSLREVDGSKFEIETEGGEVLESPSIAYDEKGVVINTPTGDRRLSSPEVSRITLHHRSCDKSQEAGAKIIDVEWDDGTKLKVTSFTISGPKAILELARRSRTEEPENTPRKPSTPIEVDKRRLVFARLKPLEPAEQVEEEKILKSQSPSDRLILKKKTALDYLDGIVLDVSDNSIGFEVDGEVFPAKREKVTAIQFFRRKLEKPFPKPALIVVDAEGSRIPAIALSMTEDKVRITTPSGETLSLDSSDVCTLDYSVATNVRLTDLERPETEVKPYFDVGAKPDTTVESDALPRWERSFYGPLKLDGKTYRNGVSFRSHTRSTFRLKEDFRLFKAKVGINDNSRPIGHVRLTIQADGKTIFDEPISGKEAAKMLSLPITGTKKLTFDVNFGEGSDIGDVLDVVEPKLVR